MATPTGGIEPGIKHQAAVFKGFRKTGMASAMSQVQQKQQTEATQ
jgi:hypothetical protein